MKTTVIALVLAATAVEARAGVFDFKDADGFTRCMQLEELVETVKTPSGYEHRYLDQDEIQRRCIAAEVALVGKTKDKALAAAGVEITRRERSPEAALEPAGALIALSLPACDDDAIYSILVHPISEGFDSDWGKQHGIPLIKRCLKHAEFKKDFLEELDSGDATRAAYACQIAREEKLVKTCKGSK